MEDSPVACQPGCRRTSGAHCHAIFFDVVGGDAVYVYEPQEQFEIGSNLQTGVKKPVALEYFSTAIKGRMCRHITEDHLEPAESGRGVIPDASR